MYELNRELFRQALKAAPEAAKTEAWDEIPPYLMENVFRPAFREEPLIPSQIDYSQFSLDDMYDMLDAAQSFYNLRHRLLESTQSLCGHTASGCSRRAFC